MDQERKSHAKPTAACVGASRPQGPGLGEPPEAWERSKWLYTSLSQCPEAGPTQGKQSFPSLLSPPTSTPAFLNWEYSKVLLENSQP